ncbi:hypothetical protein B0H14DRAFT_3139641 [Mycena olivaceomarginata]|nr:hypothetical protein B0H14DRAFT_3139641 [Mycena olivaceomarginata]
MGLKRTKVGRSIAGTDLGAKVGSMAGKGNLNGLEVWEIDRRNWVPSERRREQGTNRVSSDRSGPEWVGSAQVLIHEARFCGSGVRIGPMLDSPQLFAVRRSDGKLWPRAIANGECYGILKLLVELQNFELNNEDAPSELPSASNALHTADKSPSVWQRATGGKHTACY